MEKESYFSILLESALDDDESLHEMYCWLEHWRNDVEVCSRCRGDWYETMEVKAPPNALLDLPMGVSRKVSLAH